MDTLTMVKEAIDNPGREFATTCGRVHYKDGKLRWVHSGYTFAIDRYNLQHKWRKVPEPVEFMTVIKAYDDGKIITCQLEGSKSVYSRKHSYYGLIDDDKRAITASEILKGEWRIED